MTIALNGVTVDTGPATPAAPAPRAQASLLATLGVGDPQAVARQQLPSAVAAARTVAALPTTVPPVPKPLVRAPSSQLAAQFIAQDTSLTAEDLEIFAARQTLAPGSAAGEQVDDYLASLRIARGEVPNVKQQAAAVSSAPTQEKQETVAREALANTNATQANTAAQASQRSGVASLAASLPPLFTPLLRRVSIATSKGTDAYQLAQARIAVTRAPVEQPAP
jgi:hypothetical protein